MTLYRSVTIAAIFKVHSLPISRTVYIKPYALFRDIFYSRYVICSISKVNLGGIREFFVSGNYLLDCLVTYFLSYLVKGQKRRLFSKGVFFSLLSGHVLYVLHWLRYVISSVPGNSVHIEPRDYNTVLVKMV